MWQYNIARINLLIFHFPQYPRYHWQKKWKLCNCIMLKLHQKSRVSVIGRKVGLSTEPTTTGEAISQDDWLDSSGGMIRFALTLCHFTVY